MEVENLRRIEEIEKEAELKWSECARQYYSAEACSVHKRKSNERALERYFIKPKVFRDVSRLNTETALLSFKTSFPIAVAPTALHHLAHPEAEMAVARACEAEDVIMTTSFCSSTTIEHIAEAVPHSCKWFQLYICNDRNFTLDVLRRAETNGFKAVVLTMDSPVTGLAKNHVAPNLIELISTSENKLPKSIMELYDPTVTFQDIKWLKSKTKLPIVAKGIMRGEDAVSAIEHGVSAIIVSNHGGRMMDGVCPTIDVLAEVVNAVKGYGVDVYIDGGFRTGADIFRALALGAKAVFIGRPILWGLAVAGEAGVRRVLEILKEELTITMSLAGTARLEDISEDFLVKKEYYGHL